MRHIDADALKDKLLALSYDDWNQRVSTTWANAFADCADMVEDMPTIEPEREECRIHIDDIYRLVSGHSDYHGDDILAAFQCLAEGKIVNPIKPLAQTETVRKTGKWINGYCSECGCHAPFYSMASTYRRSNYCPDCGSYNGTDTEKNNERIYENDR